jgi:hypothetical protein
MCFNTLADGSCHRPAMACLQAGYVAPPSNRSIRGEHYLWSSRAALTPCDPMYLAPYVLTVDEPVRAMSLIFLSFPLFLFAAGCARSDKVKTLNVN